MLITEKEALKKYADEYRVWQGIPGVARTLGGRTYLTFYSGGTAEQIGNFSLLYVSDNERDFRLIAVADESGKRCYDPCVWLDPAGRLWWIWSQMCEHEVVAAVCERPDEAEPRFEAPRHIGEDVMLNKPVVTADGWLFPIAVWAKGIRSLPEEYDTAHEPGSFVYRTSDGGKTFTRLGAAYAEDRTYDEHMLLETAEGLALYTRTRYGIARALSKDGGLTFSASRDAGLGGPNSRFFIGRLKSGRVLLINHVGFSGRSHLTALLSEDDGKTFPYRLLLDERKHVSYPDAAQDPASGDLYITYDRERGCFKSSLEQAQRDAREILLARITEEDIMAGELVSAGSFLARVVNKLSEYKGEDLFVKK